MATVCHQTMLLTTKQIGDAGEYLVMAELCFAGIATLKTPNGWPGCDLIAQPPDGRGLQRISVKTGRSGIGPRGTIQTCRWTAFGKDDAFEWLAAVRFDANDGSRRIWIIPRTAVIELSDLRPEGDYRLSYTKPGLQAFESNFMLCPEGIASLALPTDVIFMSAD